MKRSATAAAEDASSDEEQEQEPPRNRPRPSPEPLDTSPIYFHAKSPGPFAELHNFYGGAEAFFQAQRLKDCEIRTFLMMLATTDLSAAEHLELQKALHPDQHTWTTEQEAYWSRDDGTPIQGVVAKLVGGLCSSEHFRSRFLSLNEHLEARGVKIPSTYKTVVGWNQWRSKYMNVPRDCVGDATMRVALAFKFRNGPRAAKYRSLLLSTHPRELHESALRGGTTRWTWSPDTSGYRGGDAIGRLLMELRSELVSEAE
jgi:hypothetical protein